MSIGENITAARQQAGLSECELADRLQVAETYLIELERGDWGPSRHMLALLADALRVPIEQLIERGNDG